MLSRQAIAFSSNKTGARKSKFQGQSPLQINLGSPFRILLDVDSDLETPSPLSLCFDLQKQKASSPLSAHSTTGWSHIDSDSDSDSNEEDGSDVSQCITITADSAFCTPPTPPTFQTTFDLPPVPCCDTDSDFYPVSDTSQYITLPSTSRFYTPPMPPTFQTTFGLPPVRCVPFACQALAGDEKSAAELFHAELERILPSEVTRELFLVDEESLRGMDDELYSAPLDAFMDVCLARLRPATLSPEVPSNEQTTSSVASPYYLVSFLDLQRHSATLPASMSRLFSKRP